MWNEDTIQITPTDFLSPKRVKEGSTNEPPMAVHGWFLEIAWKDITCR